MDVESAVHLFPNKLLNFFFSFTSSLPILGLDVLLDDLEFCLSMRGTPSSTTCGASPLRNDEAPIARTMCLWGNGRSVKGVVRREGYLRTVV